MDDFLSASQVGGASYLGRGDFVDRGGLPIFTKSKKSQVSKRECPTICMMALALPMHVIKKTQSFVKTCIIVNTAMTIIFTAMLNSIKNRVRWGWIKLVCCPISIHSPRDGSYFSGARRRRQGRKYTAHAALKNDYSVHGRRLAALWTGQLGSRL